MAGAGYRSFASSEVLTASNVNTYLMDQAVMRFTDSTDRTNNGPTLAEGMVSYLDSDDTLAFYDGSQWIPLTYRATDDARLIFPSNSFGNDYWKIDDTLNDVSLYIDGTEYLRYDLGLGLKQADDRHYFNGTDSDDYLLIDGTSTIISQGGTEHLRMQTAFIGIEGNRIRFNDATADSYYFQLTTNSDAFIVANGATVCQWIELTTDTEWALRINGPGNTTTPAYSFTDQTGSGMYYDSGGGGACFISAHGSRGMAVTSAGALAMGSNTVASAGTDVHYDSVTLDGTTMYALRQASSLAELKDGFEDWELSDEDFLRIEPTSYLSKYHYLDPETGDRMAWGRDEAGYADEVPEGALLVRQAGFVWENLAGIDLHLVSHRGVDRNAMIATNTAQIQKLMRRIEALEDS